MGDGMILVASTGQDGINTACHIAPKITAAVKHAAAAHRVFIIGDMGFCPIAEIITPVRPYPHQIGPHIQTEIIIVTTIGIARAKLARPNNYDL